MAVIYQKKAKGKVYQVRSAGRSRRLYTNGVFHSQFNPANPIAGNLWDLLLLPAFFHLDPKQIQRVLVLGVGGGAVIAQLNRFFPEAQVIGVDYDPEHLKIAKRFFHLRNARVQLQCADAVAWVQGADQGNFDLILDDLFADGGGLATAPERSVPVTHRWLLQLQKLLNPNGVLAFNVEHANAVNVIKRLVQRPGEPWQQLWRLSLAQYDNALAVLCPRAVRRRDFLRRLALEPTVARVYGGRSTPLKLSCSNL